MKIFSTEQCMLGEAPLWHRGRNSLFWLDILERKLYEKKLKTQASEADRVWQLPEYASTIALDQHRTDTIWMVTDSSFGSFNLDKGDYQVFLPLQLKPGQRTNDGSVSPAGDFFFGSMAWQPSLCDGEVYSITPEGKLVKHGVQLGIPNTFCWSRDGSSVLISDSLRQRLYSFIIEQGKIVGDSKTLFSNNKNNSGTPDGGALDMDGYLWCAHWDGHKVIKYDRNGIRAEEINLPVPRPTSCCFGGNNNQQLFITTARIDMNPEELEKHPLSGQVFIIDLAVPGAPVFPFGLND